MRTITYWEAFGETKQLLLAALIKRKSVRTEMHRWAKAHSGGQEIGVWDGAFGFRWCIVCPKGKTPKNPENWKQDKNKVGWIPRFSTKQGKALHAQMTALSEKMPGVSKLMDILKVPVFEADGGLYTNSIGVHGVKNNRLLIEITDSKYKPPTGINLKRISDMEYEKLTTPKKKMRRMK